MALLGAIILLGVAPSLFFDMILDATVPILEMGGGL